MAIINNSSLGMVRQWQTLFYNERYSNTDLHTSSHQRIPDFVKLAEAYGCLGLRAEKQEDVDAVIQQALEVNDRPVVIDFIVHPDAMVWPMVPPGSATTRSSTPAARPPCGTGRTERNATMSKHTLSVLVEDKPGVLARIAGLFSRRGFNIDSLAVGPTEHSEISRMTVVVDVEEFPLEQVTKQLNKLIEVLKVVELDPNASVQREIAPRQGARRRRRPAARSSRPSSCSGPRSSTSPPTPDHRVHRQLREAPGAARTSSSPSVSSELVQSGMVGVGRGSRSITDRSLRTA